MMKPKKSRKENGKRTLNWSQNDDTSHGNASSLPFLWLEDSGNMNSANA